MFAALLLISLTGVAIFCVDLAPFLAAAPLARERRAGART
jgi:hypothetical protein